MLLDRLPEQTERRTVEAVASSALANARTAAEYVSRALEMQGKHRTPPHSNYVKYDVYTNQETKSLPNGGDDDDGDADDDTDDEYEVNEAINQIEIPLKSYRPMTRSSHDYDYRNYGQRNRPTSLPTSTTTESSQLLLHRPSRRPELDDVPYNLIEPPYGSSNADIPKSEIIKHIQTSVMRYMKELEVEGRLPSSSSSPTSTERPHTEIKTYYRILPPTDMYNKPDNDNDHRAPDLFKPNSMKAPQSYQSFKSTTQDQHHLRHSAAATTTMTPNIDLTFRHKGRPKPIDLAALDVGQSWSHHDTAGGEHSPRKPKLHFNSDAYHEINSMTYGASGGKSTLNSGEEAPDDVATYGDSSAYGSSLQVTPVKFKDSMTHVGSTITVDSVGSAQNIDPETMLRNGPDQYRGAVHIINGIPVTNPYKFNMDQLKLD